MTVTAMPQTDADAPPKKKGRLRTIIGVLLIVVIGGAVGWFYFLAPSDAHKEPEPGEVLALESIQVNLAEGHYLRIGIALQLTAEAGGGGHGGGAMDGSKALDATIAVFSGLPVSEVTRPGQRDVLKEQLMEKLDHAYHGDVMEVYFTEFVTQ